MFAKTKTRLSTTAIAVGFVTLGLVFGLNHVASAENNEADDNPGLSEREWFEFVCENGGGKASRPTDLVPTAGDIGTADAMPETATADRDAPDSPPTKADSHEQVVLDGTQFSTATIAP